MLREERSAECQVAAEGGGGECGRSPPGDGVSSVSFGRGKRQEGIRDMRSAWVQCTFPPGGKY